MKIRNHKRYIWEFDPHSESNLKYCRFKYKKDLMDFLSKNFYEAASGVVTYRLESFTTFCSIRQWYVWYNEYQYKYKNVVAKVVLIQKDFKGNKFISKPHKTSTGSKKYFAFSEKIISLMCNIGDAGITPQKAKKLTELFIKRGLDVNKTLTEEDWEYINGYIEDGIDFFYWSDRCGALRMRTIYEYFKLNNLI